ncbi:MAG: hypothetical protein ACRCS9_12640 [Hyphomicrobium sp.]
MQSDDSFRSSLDATIRQLDAWARSVGEIATAEISRDAATWSLRVQPHVIGACPFELLLRRDQRYDVVVAGEIYEDLEIDDWNLFHHLVTAIAAGDVARLDRRSALTGALLSRATRVTCADGSTWLRARTLAGQPAVAPSSGDVTTVARAFLPYRR